MLLNRNNKSRSKYYPVRAMSYIITTDSILIIFISQNLFYDQNSFTIRIKFSLAF